MTRARALPQTDATISDAPAATIVCWEHGGHRLAYVAAVARAAAEGGFDVELITSTSVRTSDPFETHLEQYLQSGTLTVRIDDRVRNWRGRVSLISSLRKSAARLILPDADVMIYPMIALCLVRLSPAHSSLVIMRPPDSHGTRLGEVRRLCKSIGLLALGRLAPSVDLMLLEDSLASGDDRSWQGPLAAAGIPLFDPGDFFLSDPDLPLPRELDTNDGRAIVTVLGGISARKRVDVVLDAMLEKSIPPSVHLVVAGPLYEDARQLLRHPAVQAGSATFIDRYLSNDEMSAVLRASRAVFVLYGERLSSGITMAAAMSGTWVIAEAGSRTARTALRHGFGMESAVDSVQIAAAMEEAIKRTPPTPVPLPTTLDFGKQLLHGSAIDRAVRACGQIK